jgi:anthranilate synthase component I
VPGHDVLSLAAFPDLAALHEAHPERYPCLLESVSRGSPRARYDILFGFPSTSLTLHADGRLERDGRQLQHGDFLAALDEDWCHAASTAPGPDGPPFTGGWFVYLGYEFASRVEPVLGDLKCDPAFPVAQAMRVPAAVIRDHSLGRTLLVCEREQAPELLPAMQRDLDVDATVAGSVFTKGQVQEDDPEAFLAGVRRIQEYIRAGDVFQVNLARRWRVQFPAAPGAVSIYRRLREANPGPFAGLMRLAMDRAVISSSPERLVSVHKGEVSTRPIAGTFPRGTGAGEDLRLAQELLGHPKERAEHVMLIDLERNDLGRVCRPGSVQVAELMGLESYRHVHHIVSEVRGELRNDVSPADVIRAVFPGGTITGCPKVRCMQIIAELERTPRGAYTGSMGYINRDGSMDLNILIRTLVQNGETLSLHAGAGIVADSIPERELAETRAKARGMLAAVGAVR